jgi:hypothetical protein
MHLDSVNLIQAQAIGLIHQMPSRKRVNPGVAGRRFEKNNASRLHWGKPAIAHAITALLSSTFGNAD